MATTVDYLPGDPASHVLGRPEEKPAKRHAPQPPKPNKTARGILADVELRIQELEPLLEEYKLLLDVRDILMDKPKPRRNQR
jgi:hypothetical protein